MNKSRLLSTVAECKIQASFLFKSLRSLDTKKALDSAKRLKVLPEFKNLSTDEIIKADVKRKHALAVISFEKGFKSWSELKCQLPFIRGGFLNQWFKSYDDAKSYLESNRGYLLPFQRQFFVCDSDYIDNLGLNSKDKDWELIAFDWVNPTNQEAWQRLYKKWMIIQGGRHA